MNKYYSIFGSRSVTEHILRGILSIAAVWAAYHFRHLVWPVVVFVFAAFVLWRGCPGCWVVGLAETVNRRCGGKNRILIDGASCPYKASSKKL